MQRLARSLEDMNSEPGPDWVLLCIHWCPEVVHQHSYLSRTISTAVTFFRTLGLQHPSEYQRFALHILNSVKNWMWYSTSTWLGPFGAQISAALSTWPLSQFLGLLHLLIHFISFKSWGADTDFCKVMFQSHNEPTPHSSVLSLEKHVISITHLKGAKRVPCANQDRLLGTVSDYLPSRELASCFPWLTVGQWDTKIPELWHSQEGP